MALHISGNEKDSISMWGKLETDLEKIMFNQDKLHMDQIFKHKNEIIKIIVGGWEFSYKLFLKYDPKSRNHRKKILI